MIIGTLSRKKRERNQQPKQPFSDSRESFHTTKKQKERNEFALFLIQNFDMLAYPTFPGPSRGGQAELDPSIIPLR